MSFVCFVFLRFLAVYSGNTGGRSHRIFHPPSFCGACLNISREKDSAIPFPRTNDLIVLHKPVAPVAQRYLVTL